MSWWPFGAKNTNAASFEKALAQLSDKIKKETARNDQQRLRLRKYKVLWTIYAAFTYILITAIFLLVYGWDRWGIVEYTVVAGGPPFIYGIRTALDTYYGWRVQTSQTHLDELNKQRETTIQKLKAATKYDSTQQLLEKYGGSPKNRQRQPSPLSKDSKKKAGSDNDRLSWPQGGRTGLAPPPTANIASKAPPLQPPQNVPNAAVQQQNRRTSRPMSTSGIQTDVSEEFAPNAFDAASPPRRPPMPSHPSQYATAERKWYDRVLDVMLGEDEGQAKNRIALICASCRLVNGQAPPGTRSLEEVGRWRCGECHAWNGTEESEEARMLRQIMKQQQQALPDSPTVPQSAVTDPGPLLRASMEDEDSGGYEHVEDDIGEEEDESDEHAGDQTGGESGQGSTALEETPARSTRSRARVKRVT